MDPGVTSVFDKSGSLILPVAVLLMGWCKDSAWWNPLLIQNPASPKGWARASFFPIPGYEGHWHGQLELKTAPLAQGRSNHESTLFSIWKPGGALGEDNHIPCTACIRGLKIIKLFPCCAVSLLHCFEQLLREYFSALGASWLMHYNGTARMEVVIWHQLYYAVQACIWMHSVWSRNMVV